ncbi:MAG TPA: nucleoside transporter C-terminal domain-containing protein, partial [Planctomycetaceae bacterium]|nr:nucleoside transporter C-terminal domain-containing protein [Planctomycetaceae bacterium]
FMQRTLGTSGAESLVAAANIFTGQTEAPLIIQPYLARMTRSEIMTLMVAGFATVAGGVMAAFIGMGIDAGHLLTASVISAPAAVVIAKILQPEVDEPVTRNTLGAAVKPDTINAFDALTTGAADGLRLALNITAMVIAFLALVAVVDLALTSATGVFGSPWTLADVFGWVFSPLAWAMGVDPGDERKVGELLGLKTVANEFLAYDRLATMHDLGPRSKVIAVYALCGFANLGSVGVQIGGLSLLAPSRRADFATLGWRAMLGGNLACFMTACIAGLLI